ncbi:MAG: hypothetical protein ACE5FF_01285 [Saprospiraceae bacterium]
MAFKFRICRNDTTTVLRKLFNATPMRVPEASVQPLLVIAEKAGKTDKRGALKHLLSNHRSIKTDVQDDPVSDVSLERTRSMDWDFGLKLLDGIFKGFNLPSATIATKLEGAKEISLSFHNVRRHWVDKNALGSALHHKKVDLTHPAVGIFTGDDAYNMLLVTDVIVSNAFSINVEKTKDNSFEVEAPTFQEIIDEANLKLKVKSSSKNSITFEGEDFLTFAFSCVKLELDQQTGALGVGLSVVTREVATPDGTKMTEVEEPQPIELDDDLFEPGLLEWD